ncbi:MAG: hypothetical protein KAK00_08790 [Nanoarchaeota archaeon]|nr:hypothetical protein [Nanoarchaeota archaeon]
MMPYQHFLASSILALILYPSFGISSLFIFITGFLIDIDHILYYYIRFKKFSIKETYVHCLKMGKKINKEEYKKLILIFHNWELMFVLLLLSIVNKIFLVMSIGLLFHLIMDGLSKKKGYGKLYRYSIIAKKIASMN